MLPGLDQGEQGPEMEGGDQPSPWAQVTLGKAPPTPRGPSVYLRVGGQPEEGTAHFAENKTMTLGVTVGSGKGPTGTPPGHPTHLPSSLVHTGEGSGSLGPPVRFLSL